MEKVELLSEILREKDETETELKTTMHTITQKNKKLSEQETQLRSLVEEIDQVKEKVFLKNKEIKDAELLLKASGLLSEEDLPLISEGGEKVNKLLIERADEKIQQLQQVTENMNYVILRRSNRVIQQENKIEELQLVLEQVKHNQGWEEWFKQNSSTEREDEGMPTEEEQEEESKEANQIPLTHEEIKEELVLMPHLSY